MWQIILEHGVYLADGEGDPPRTLCEENALQIQQLSEANKLLKDARRHRPFIHAVYEYIPASDRRKIIL